MDLTGLAWLVGIGTAVLLLLIIVIGTIRRYRIAKPVRGADRRRPQGRQAGAQPGDRRVVDGPVRPAGRDGWRRLRRAVRLPGLSPVPGVAPDPGAAAAGTLATKADRDQEVLTVQWTW